MEDLDADRFVHWTVLRIPPTVLRIPPQANRFEEVRIPTGAVETDRRFGERGWGGPGARPRGSRTVTCRPLGGPACVFGAGPASSPDEVREALAGAGVARGTLIGHFVRVGHAESANLGSGCRERGKR